MFIKKSLVIIAMFSFGFLFAPSLALANPIACYSFSATRSGDDVVLELLLLKNCYDEAPAPEDTLLMRDLFVQDVDFQLSEDESSFYLTAVDPNVSSNKHRYTVSFDSYEGVSHMGADVEGTECADLDVDLGAQEAVLVLSLKAECVTNSGVGLEYIVEHYSEVEHYSDVLEPLEWAEQETQAGIECTATHVSEYDGGYVSYEVGVRSEDDTYYAWFGVPPHEGEGEGEENEDPENENNGDQMNDGEGSGCNMHGNSTSQNAPFFLLLLAPLFFWRRRKSA